MSRSLLTTVIGGLISGIFGSIAHRYATTPAAPSAGGSPSNPANPAQTDAFAGLPFGLPGHPILNQLFGGVNNLVTGAPPSNATSSQNQAMVTGFIGLIKQDPSLVQLAQSLLQQAAAQLAASQAAAQTSVPSAGPAASAAAAGS